MMRFGDSKPSTTPDEEMAEGEGDEGGGDMLSAMAGKKAGSALASAIESGDGAAIYAAFKKLNGLCASGGE